MSPKFPHYVEILSINRRHYSNTQSTEFQSIWINFAKVQLKINCHERILLFSVECCIGILLFLKSCSKDDDGESGNSADSGVLDASSSEFEITPISDNEVELSEYLGKSSEFFAFSIKGIHKSLIE